MQNLINKTENRVTEGNNNQSIDINRYKSTDIRNFTQVFKNKKYSAKGKQDFLDFTELSDARANLTFDINKVKKTIKCC